MKLEELKGLLCDLGYNDTIVFENPDFSSAVIGISTDGCVIYDYEKMIEDLMVKEDFSIEDATDWIEYNTIRSIPYMGEKAPIILYNINEF